jgi:hypothetical protein
VENSSISLFEPVLWFCGKVIAECKQMKEKKENWAIL